MKPVFSATPTPSITTGTTPSGANPVKVGTSCTMKVVRAAPVSWLAMRNGSPVRGFVSANSIGDRMAEAIQVSTSSSRNRIAGSGSRLPTVSMPFRARSTKPPPSGGAFRSGRAFAMAEPRLPPNTWTPPGRGQSSTSNR